jgi:mannose-6-phosphate isomerase-like protein (cupin superfamily)
VNGPPNPFHCETAAANSKLEDGIMDYHAKLFANDEHKAIRMGRMTFHFKMSADDTNGAYTVMEAVVPPESGSGLHRHWSYDEAALVIEGKFECHVDGKQTTLGAGESVYWPRGSAHKFRSVGPDTGRIVFICSPGKIFEDFVAGITASQVTTGSANSGPAIDFRGFALKHGIEFMD